MSLLLMTESGEQHGLINTIANSVSDHGFKHFDPKWKKEAEKMKAEDQKMVKARYINKRGNHERLDKPYMRWAGEPIRMYHLIPGYTYELPMGFINEINSKKNVLRSDRVDENGKIAAKDTVGEAIHELVPVSF
jgi:hypothetical protein